MASENKPFWWPETPQTLIGVVLVLAVVILTFVLAFKDPSGDMFKFMIGGLMTTGFAAIIGFYFGSSAGSKSKDDALMLAAKSGASTPPPVTPWWPLFTDAEKNAVTAAAAGDARVQAFVTASASGYGSQDDLTYLVSLGIMTQARATEIAAR